MFKYEHKHSTTRNILTKTLTIRDEVYDKLVSVKGKDESFSELFERLVMNQSPKELLNSIRGKIELTKEEKKGLLQKIEQDRSERRL
jgi:predicted CopG family antitoxin